MEQLWENGSRETEEERLIMKEGKLRLRGSTNQNGKSNNLTEIH